MEKKPIKESFPHLNMEDNELLKLVHQGQQLYLQAHGSLAYILEPIVSAIKSKKKLYSNPKV